MLNLVESRQFSERGLLHISNEAHKFFMSLEQTRVEKINMRMLERLECLKASLVQVSIQEVCESTKLENEFINCFELTSIEKQVR